jgi:aspartyl-tRNA(Asn)/glutamyl-tRNA(Gln) amidotransferase subunit B
MGMKVEREVRHFNADTKMTVSLRKKEFEEDYGYIFEPDLTDIEISDSWIKSIEKRMPELPDSRVKRFVKDYKIADRDAKVIVYVDKALADFFEECIKIYKKPDALSKWIVTDLLKCLNYQDVTIRESKVKPKTFVELIQLIDKKEITERLAKEIIKEYVATGKSPKEIIKKSGISKIEEKELEKIIKEVIKENTKAVDDYKSGNEKSIQFLIGQVLRKTKSSGDPNKIKELIKKLI